MYKVLQSKRTSVTNWLGHPSHICQVVVVFSSNPGKANGILIVTNMEKVL